MKLKFLKLKYFPNFQLLEKFTGCKRKDAVTYKAWIDLHNLIMYGKESLCDNNSRRRKKWIHKMRNRGYCHFNKISGRWRLTWEGCQIIVKYYEELETKKIS